MKITLETTCGTLEGEFSANNRNHNDYKTFNIENPWLVLLHGKVKVNKVEYNVHIELRKGWNPSPIVGYVVGPYWGIRTQQDFSFERTDNGKVNLNIREKVLKEIVEVWTGMVTPEMGATAYQEKRLYDIHELEEKIKEKEAAILVLKQELNKLKKTL